MTDPLRWLLILTLIVLPACEVQKMKSERLQDLFDREWQARLAEDPLLATSVGVHDYNHLLPSMTLEVLARHDQLWRGFLEELDAFEVAALSEVDRINHRIFRDQLEDRISGFRFGAYRIPLNADSGFHTAFARLSQMVPLNTVEDYENYIHRMEAFPRYVQEQIVLMRIGLESGMSLPRVVQGFNKVKDRHLNLGMKAEAVSTQQPALQGREEAFA